MSVLSRMKPKTIEGLKKDKIAIIHAWTRLLRLLHRRPRGAADFSPPPRDPFTKPPTLVLQDEYLSKLLVLSLSLALHSLPQIGLSLVGF
jgi:hypothetical protein